MLLFYLYSSSFKLLLCWLRSLAAALQFEIYWVYIFPIIRIELYR